MISMYILDEALLLWSQLKISVVILLGASTSYDPGPKAKMLICFEPSLKIM